MQRELIILDEKEVERLDKKRVASVNENIDSLGDSNEETKKQKFLNIAEELAKNRNTVNVLESSPSATPSPSMAANVLVNSEVDAKRAKGTPKEVSQLKISSLLSNDMDKDTTISKNATLLKKSNSTLSIVPVSSTDTSVSSTKSKPAAKTPAKTTTKASTKASKKSSTKNQTKTPAKAKKSNSTNTIVTKPKDSPKLQISTLDTKKKISNSAASKTNTQASKSNTPKPKPKSKPKTAKIQTPSSTDSSASIQPATAPPATSTLSGTSNSTKAEKDSSSVKNEKLGTIDKSSVSSTLVGSSNTTSKKKSPKRLLPAPQIKSPSLLSAFEKSSKEDGEESEPIVILDIPLHSTRNEEYLDENGQVVFNYAELEKEKFSKTNGNKTTDLYDLKVAKRNLFSDLNENSGKFDGVDGHEEDLENDDDDDDDDDDDENLEEENEDGNLTSSPSKKRSHPNKGKNLIGKYDVEDPFIDDSELAWEEQRAATKDGFFVYFGPLIEKGHYASLERINGKMKRGGIKN